MTTPNPIIALLLAAVLGNTLMFQLWAAPLIAPRTLRQRLLVWLLLALVPLAVLWAGREIYHNRSENVLLAALLYLPLQAVFTTVIFFRYNRRCVTPAGWGRLLTGNVLLLLVLSTSLLAAGEVYFRFFYDTTDSFAYTKVTQRWTQRHYRRNQATFRDDVEYSFRVAPGKRRVSFFGDSFTAGHGIKNVGDRFANRIRPLHPDWEIHVIAGNGLDTGAEVDFLKTLNGLGYEMDQVVLVYCLNDVNDLLPDWEPVLQTAGGRKINRPPICEASYFLDLLYHRLVIARIPWVRNYFSFVLDAYRGATWEKQQERLRSLRDTVESRGGKLIVVTFPFLHALGPEYPYQFVHDELNAFWRKESVPHLDLLPVFKEMSPRQITVNRFDAHPNELANELAAKAIDKYLVRQMRINSQPAVGANQSQLSPQSR